MAGGVQALVTGMQDGAAVPAASKVTANARVTASQTPVGLVSDVLTFPGPSTVGNWITPNQRTLVNGMPTIGQSSIGQAIIPALVPVIVPVMVTLPDPRVSAM
jgi:hypothetical protein